MLLDLPDGELPEVQTGGGKDRVGASRLHFGQLTIRQIKEHLAARALPVRL